MRMAGLGVIASHTVNGVAALHPLNRVTHPSIAAGGKLVRMAYLGVIAAAHTVNGVVSHTLPLLQERSSCAWLTLA